MKATRKNVKMSWDEFRKLGKCKVKNVSNENLIGYFKNAMDLKNYSVTVSRCLDFVADYPNLLLSSIRTHHTTDKHFVSRCNREGERVQIPFDKYGYIGYIYVELDKFSSEELESISE